MGLQIHPSDLTRLLPYLVPVVVIFVIMRRNLRPRPLRPERLWLTPALILLAAGSALFVSPMPTDPLTILILIAALALGAAIGWYRGRMTQMSVDPVSHDVTVQVSAMGSLLILGLFAVRYGLRSVTQQNAGLLHLNAVQAADALLLLAVGTICAQRLELWLRATRLRQEAREAGPGPAPGGAPPTSGQIVE